MQLELKVNAADESKRVDLFIASTQPDKSRSYWQRLIERGDVLINGRVATSNSKVKAGDIVIITEQKQEVSSVDIPVIYEDEDVIVLNKPAGMLTHAKGDFNPEFTVADFMKSRTKDDDSNRAGIVHRLDRDTSGVMIAAKTKAAKSFLQKQFSTRQVEKVYFAAVEGTPEPPHAVLELSIERNPKQPASFRIGAQGKPAVTEYKVLASKDDISAVRLLPKTGRTHQLRVHMQHVGAPIIGDHLYSKNKAGERLQLHAASLRLRLPNGEQKTFTTPLPDDMLPIVKEAATIEA